MVNSEENFSREYGTKKKIYVTNSIFCRYTIFLFLFAVSVKIQKKFQCHQKIEPTVPISRTLTKVNVQ